MARFDDILAVTLWQEGVGRNGNPTGLNTTPGDPGGTTNFGISQRAWDKIQHKLPYANYAKQVESLRRDQAEVIYQNEYYLPLHGDDLPRSVAMVLFDSAVNQGAGTATQILQRAMRITDDGIWGSQTTSALRLAVRDVPRLLDEICFQRCWEYAKDARGAGEHSRFPWFLASNWLIRVHEVRDAAIKMGV